MRAFRSFEQCILSFRSRLSSIGLLVLVLLPGLVLSGCDSAGSNDGVEDFQGVEVEKTIEVGESLTGELEMSDAQLKDLNTQLSDESYIDLYELDLDKTEEVEIELTSTEFSTFLALYDRSGNRKATVNKVILRELNEGEYIIVVNSLSVSTGEYQLSVK